MKNNTPTPIKQFGGDKKIGTSLLSLPENRLKQWLIPKIPPWIETYHLTMTTLLWSLTNVMIAFAVKTNIKLLSLVSAMIILQYLTDLLDGELGRQRETGLIKWGFYMDHFLDFLFLCSLVFVGFMSAPIGLGPWFFALFVVLSSFMVNAFLSFGATNEFTIYHYGIGPTEIRILFILTNTFITLVGTNCLTLLVPLAVIFCLAGLGIQTYLIQKKLWYHDMQTKET